MVWPIVCRRLESPPNINAAQLFDELCVQFPGGATPRQHKTLLRRVNLWRRDARAGGVSAVRDILGHLGEPTAPPRSAHARGPPPWEAAGAEHDPTPDAALPPIQACEFDQRIAW